MSYPRKPPIPMAHRLTRAQLNHTGPRPYLVYREGRWLLYRTRWKSQWPTAACISAPTIPELIERLKRNRDGRFGRPA